MDAQGCTARSRTAAALGAVARDAGRSAGEFTGKGCTAALSARPYHPQAAAKPARPSACPAPRAAVDVDKAYVYQMAAYRRALQAIYPGRSVQCVLLWTDGPFLLELPAQQMDDLLASSGLI
jgi:hypothetical protein